jgi:hypothetical protein
MASVQCWYMSCFFIIDSWTNKLTLTSFPFTTSSIISRFHRRTCICHTRTWMKDREELGFVLDRMPWKALDDNDFIHRSNYIPNAVMYHRIQYEMLAVTNVSSINIIRLFSSCSILSGSSIHYSWVHQWADCDTMNWGSKSHRESESEKSTIEHRTLSMWHAWKLLQSCWAWPILN